jgi:hypothetical protein
MFDYEQKSAGSVTPAVEDPFVFSASALSPTNKPLTDVRLQGPGGISVPLTNIPFGRISYFAMESYASQTTLDTARPNGTYTFSLTRSDGSKPTVPVVLPDNRYPPTPEIVNFAATQAVDANADFVLQWNGFTGAGANDTVSVVIAPELGMPVFTAPDPCVPRPLPNTATSVTIPKGTFQAASTYKAMLTYMRFVVSDTNSVPEMYVMAAFQKQLNFAIRTAGGTTPPTPPKFTSYTMLPNGHFELKLSGQAGRSYVIESSPDLRTWTPGPSLTAPADGVITYEDASSSSAKQMFYRAKAN